MFFLPTKEVEAKAFRSYGSVCGSHLPRARHQTHSIWLTLIQHDSHNHYTCVAISLKVASLEQIDQTFGKRLLSSEMTKDVPFDCLPFEKYGLADERCNHFL